MSAGEPSVKNLFQGIENAMTYEEWELQKLEEQEDAMDGLYQDDFHGDQ